MTAPSAPRLRVSRLSDIDLAEAYPWPDANRWLRAMMLLSLDGAVARSDGRSGSLSSPTDRSLLAEVRRLSDVVLIGAGTLRTERYQPMTARPDAAGQRDRAGLAPAPVLAVVSASLDLPWDEPVFTESTIQPIVVTHHGADADLLSVARTFSDVIVLPGSSIDAAAVIAALAARGLRRIVCEGGPRLLASLSAAGLVDEVDITFAPLLAGGGQVMTGAPLAEPRGYDLVHVIADEGFLFTRYCARDENADTGTAT
ncbi:MAG: dihydrofolate reductase family protein [Actinobacteria bacterium]|nr:dihydrofolate reductase family protein [Actinomycetota bacterium]